MVNNPVGDTIVRTSIAFGVIDTVAVALRLLARWRSNAAFDADDALITASLIPLLAMIVIDHFSVEAGGLGLSTAVNLELGHGPSRISMLLKLLMSSIVTYTLTTTLVRLSILVLYRRIFSTTAFKRNTLIVEVAVMLWFIVALFTDLFQCRPFQAAFDPERLFTNQCINLQAYYWGISASSLCLDVGILYMPLHMVWGLKLPTRQKIALSGIFLVGGIACVAGAMRIITVGILQKEGLTYTLAKEYTWSQLEPALAILCACLVTLRPLFLNLNLNMSKFSSRFSRSKSLSLSKPTDSTDSSKGHGSNIQWAGTQRSRPENSTKLGSQGISRKGGGHVVTIDLGKTDFQVPYTQMTNPGGRHGGDTRNQQP